MRKKDLINQNIMLFEQLRKVELENTSLRKKNKSLEKEVAELNEKLMEIRFEETKIVESEVDTSKLSAVSELDESVSYGSNTIGEIVLKATELNSELSVNSSPDNITLINLILGRTEISKSEILSIVSDDCSIETKKSKIDTVKNQAFEYFESVMAQID